MNIKLISRNPAWVPSRGSQDAAGFDLYAADACIIRPLESWSVSTGVSIEMPPDTVGMICPRSGLAKKHGLTILNAPGIIDPDFRGEIEVLLINLSSASYNIHIGDRIAQIIFAKFVAPTFEQVEFLNVTPRASRGFGSTGV